jgi:hypothetical protein
MAVSEINAISEISAMLLRAEPYSGLKPKGYLGCLNSPPD